MEVAMSPWDSTELLRNESDLAMYLAVALEEEDLPTIHAATVRIAARARGGAANLARESGLSLPELEAAMQGSEEDALPVLKKLAAAYRNLSAGRKVA